MSSRRRHEGHRDDPQPCKCLGVFGLSLYTSERELEAEFKRFGALEKVQVVLDGHTGRSRGFAFIYYENQVCFYNEYITLLCIQSILQDDATEARNAMNGGDLDGRKIRVDYSITKRPHTPTPGMYMGRPTDGGRRGGGDRGWRGGGDRRRRSPSPYRGRRSRSPAFRRRSPSPYYGRRDFRSRSRSFSPRRREYSPRRY